MRVIIAGSRTIKDYELLKKCIELSGFDITTVVCGMARGVDMLGYRYATEDPDIFLKTYPANWEKYGKAAGIIRNVEMAENADALIAITNGSKGTAHMIATAEKKGLKVFVHYVS